MNGNKGNGSSGSGSHRAAESSNKFARIKSSNFKFERVKSKTTIQKEKSKPKTSPKSPAAKDKSKKTHKDKKDKKKHKHKHKHKDKHRQKKPRLSSSNGKPQASSPNSVDLAKQAQRKLKQYKQWKQYIPFLYEYIAVHVLPWPSLTVCWVPSITGENVKVDGSSDENVTTHRILVGCNAEASGNEQYISLCSVNLPNENENESKNSTKYAANMKNIGRYTQRSTIQRMKIMPQRPELVASITASGDVIIINTGDANRENGNEFKLELTLKGHTNEGYGLDWSSKNKGRLLSSCEDTVICLWDIESNGGKSGGIVAEINPVRRFRGHKKSVGDVRWHHREEHVFGSVSDDCMLALWDTRVSGDNVPSQQTKGHDSDINCLDFSKFDDNYLVTGGGNSTVYLWDRRRLKSKTHEFKHHSGGILQLHWCPFQRNVFCTSSEDTKVCIWDIDKIGIEQTPEEALDGAPELLFLHSGHTEAVFDVSWNPDQDWTLASTAEDNVVQIWSVAMPIRA